MLTARAAGNEPIDAVYTNVRDLDALKEESVRAHHDGFAAKAIIDPPHAEIVNRAFRPAEADLTRMRRIVEAMEVAGTKGAIQLDRELIEIPHYKAALATLQREDSE